MEKKAGTVGINGAKSKWHLAGGLSRALWRASSQGGYAAYAILNGLLLHRAVPPNGSALPRLALPKVFARVASLRGGTTKQSSRTLNCILFALATSTAMPQADHGMNDPTKVDVVVIDPGHGGKDPGNIGTGRYKTTEKHVALNVSKLVGKYIQDAYPDVKVIYTREDDRFIELKERCEIANRAKADVFISIHCNANDNHDPHGTETFVMGLHKTEANLKTAQRENSAILMEADHELKYEGFDPKDPESVIGLSIRQNAHLMQSTKFADLIETQFKERVGRNARGVKQAGFIVISYTTMPAVLVELGFLTNDKEEDFLQGDQGQEYMASAIYRAFKEYKATIEGTDVAMEPVVKPDTTTAPVNKEGEKEDKPEPVATKTDESGVRFKVQIAVSKKKIKCEPKNFNGLEGVREYEGGGMYKYVYGNERTPEGATKLKELCREKGYEGAFIVAFQDGARIELEKALTLAKQLAQTR
ncbi:MAG: N-acetylmuramoyl-L-alanine amidase [Flavobacteriales bacterium]|nr:MAG: N-acetylmuramoyl-L-alanine amidase [Flavobacteriales bacterium]